MHFLLGGLIAWLVLWAGNWQFRLRDFGLMIVVHLTLRVHSAIVQRETLKALTADAASNGSVREALTRHTCA